MTGHETTAVPQERGLKHFPISLFSMVMGLSGLTLASQKAEGILEVSTGIPLMLAAASALSFVLLAGLYAAKSLLHWRAVRAELDHPVTLHFFPTTSISLILLSVIALRIDHAAASMLFAVGVPVHLALTLYVLHSWFNRSHFETTHLNPAWFIPIVGNVLVPISGVSLGYMELSWFCFSIGIVFWLVLFAIIMNRVMFHHPLHERLAPTLFILIAPPSAGFIAYEQLTSQLDGAARVLYGVALFMTLFLATQAPRLARLRFYLSWWAYSFPLAAFTVASFVMHEKTRAAPYLTIAATLLVVLAAIVVLLVARTTQAFLRGQVFAPD